MEQSESLMIPWLKSLQGKLTEPKDTWTKLPVKTIQQLLRSRQISGSAVIEFDSKDNLLMTRFGDTRIPVSSRSLWMVILDQHGISLDSQKYLITIQDGKIKSEIINEQSN